MADDSESRRPTHEIKILDIDSGDSAQVAVVWYRPEKDYFSIKLNPGVVLSYDNMKGKALTMFRARTPEEAAAARLQAQAAQVAAQSTPVPATIKTWGANHPEYVRKVHYAPLGKHQCANRHKGKANLTEDTTKVTCRNCLFAIETLKQISQLRNS